MGPDPRLPSHPGTNAPFWSGCCFLAPFWVMKTECALTRHCSARRGAAYLDELAETKTNRITVPRAAAAAIDRSLTLGRMHSGYCSASRQSPVFEYSSNSHYIGFQCKKILTNTTYTIESTVSNSMSLVISLSRTQTVILTFLRGP